VCLECEKKPKGADNCDWLLDGRPFRLGVVFSFLLSTSYFLLSAFYLRDLGLGLIEARTRADGRPLFESRECIRGAKQAAEWEHAREHKQFAYQKQISLGQQQRLAHEASLSAAMRRPMLRAAKLWALRACIQRKA